MTTYYRIQFDIESDDCLTHPDEVLAQVNSSFDISNAEWWDRDEDEHDERITVWDVWIPFVDEWMRQVKEQADNYKVEVYTRETSAGQGYAVISGFHSNVVAWMQMAYEENWVLGPGLR